MREILFRGKRVDNGAWVYGSLLVYPDGYTYIMTNNGFVYEPDKIPVFPSTVGQCTGLGAKNHVKIYEGDILRGDIPECLQDNQNCVGLVKYEESAFVIDFHSTRESWKIQKVGFCSFENYTVIGNVYDNPELLEACHEAD